MDDIPEFLKVQNRGKPLPAVGGLKLVGTYTNLNTYRNCPERMRRTYITKDLGAFVKTPEMEWGDKVHEAFERRIGAKKPLPIEMQQWESFCLPFDSHQVLCEQKIAIDRHGRLVDYWDKVNCWFRGQADIALVNGTKGYIADLKTGNSRYEDPFELRTNAMLLKARFPQLTSIKGSYLWLKDNRVGQPHDLSNTEVTFHEVGTLMAQVQLDYDSGQWEKQKSGLCGYCPVTDCEHYYVARPK